jgi:hypothetical protein
MKRGLNYLIAAAIGALAHKYAPSFSPATAPKTEAPAELGISIFGGDDDVEIYDVSAAKISKVARSMKPTLLVRVGSVGKIPPADEKAWAKENNIPFRHFAAMPEKSRAALNKKFKVLWHLTLPNQP